MITYFIMVIADVNIKAKIIGVLSSVQYTQKVYLNYIHSIHLPMFVRVTSPPLRKVQTTLIARFMGPTWGPSGAGRTPVGPMNFAIWAHKYNHIICVLGASITVTSHDRQGVPKSPPTRLFVQQIIQAINNKTPYYSPLMRKRFHVITSSWRGIGDILIINLI